MEGLHSLQWRKFRKKESREAMRPAVEKALSLTTHFSLGFVTGYVKLFDGCAPFGVAMTARSGGGLGGVMCLLGASAGYLASGGLRWSLRYESALILTYTVAFLMRSRRIGRRAWFMPTAAAFIMASTGAMNAWGELYRLEELARLVTETLLTGLGAYLFLMALTTVPTERESEELRRNAGGILLLSCLLMSMTRLELGHTVCLGRLAAVLTVMAAGFSSGASAGAAFGVMAGLSVDMAGGGNALFTICYGFAGLMSGALRQQGRLVFVLTFVSAHALAVFWNWPDVELTALYEVFAASVLFMLLPARWLSIVAATVQKPAPGTGEAELRRYTARRTAALAEAFEDMYQTARRGTTEPPEEGAESVVYDRAAETVCTGCKRKNLCWRDNGTQTLALLGDATPALEKKGRLEPKDLPKGFREMCPSADTFRTAVNMELRARIYRRQMKERSRESRSAVWEQYHTIAGVLSAAAEELGSSIGPDALSERRMLRYLNTREIEGSVAAFRTRGGRLRVAVDSPRLGQLLKEEDCINDISRTLGTRMCRPAGDNRENNRLILLEAEPLAASVGVAAMKKEGESVSGDRGTYFKTDEGVLCVLLSDGMGSGEAAARESVSVVQMLEKLLRSGVEPAMAMKLLNSVLLLRGSDHWGYATVDLMCIDLFSGQTGFFKYGAAPSYVRMGKSVRRLQGKSMAAGALPGEGEAPDVVRMHLKPGGMAVIVSDGVVEGEDDGWLRKLFSEFEGSDTRELARTVLKEAGRRGGVADDMTVLAISLEARR